MPPAAVDSMAANGSSFLAYPRTGKRGVPQQFARRLYEMLQSEAKLSAAKEDYEVLISWSESGLAFRIYDVDAFTSSVLPKYFRTKKFSSFQRNLNLYGFAKVRRGPDTDMYAHSSFVRNKPEFLSHLRKCTSGTRRSISHTPFSCSSSCDESDSSQGETASTSSTTMGSLSPLFPPKAVVQASGSSFHLNKSWLSFEQSQPSPFFKASCLKSRHQPVIGRPGGTGRLDLLALAVEHAT